MHSESIFSPHWFQVAALTPRLRSHLGVHKHRYRGATWYVLDDRASGNHHRLNEAAYGFVGLLNGRRKVQEAWELANERLGDEAPTQEQVIDILDRLHARNLLEVDVSSDFEVLLQRRRREERRTRQGKALNPLMIRLPLYDPDRLLARLAPRLGPLLGRPGLVIWLLLVTLGLALAGVHWDELRAQPLASMSEPRHLLLMLTVYPLMKLLHELAHGLLIRRWGGEVHELGVALLVLMPVPYVDGKAAGTFPDKWQRAGVAAAGVAAELGLAALALLAWLNTEPGLLRDVLFSVMLIGGVSSLLFNGNPLMRFDAYYVLADLLEIPDLWQRSRRYYAQWLQRLAGLEVAHPAARDRGEARWLALYGALSLTYWVAILCGLVLLASRLSPVAGAVVALWAVVTQLVLPLGRGVKRLWLEADGSGQALGALIRLGTPVGAVVAALFLVPLGGYSEAEGVVQVPEESRLLAGADCLVSEAAVTPGQRVRKGQVLVRCDRGELDASVREVEARLREFQAYVDSHLLDDPVERRLAEDKVASTRRELAALREEQRRLTVRAPLGGRFVVGRSDPLPGRFFAKGEPIGFVQAEHYRPTVVAAIEQDRIGLVRDQGMAVQVRPWRDAAPVVKAAGLRLIPGAVERLPSPALAAANGGSIAAVPDGEGTFLAARPVYLIEVRLPEGTGDWPAGMRASLRLTHAPLPLGTRLLHRLRRLMLDEIHI